MAAAVPADDLEYLELHLQVQSELKYSCWFGQQGQQQQWWVAAVACSVCQREYAGLNFDKLKSWTSRTL